MNRPTLSVNAALLQRGAAAIELALALPVMLLILYGLVTFGGVFYTQLTLSRAVEDGARAIGLGNGTPNELDIRQEVINSLAMSHITPSGADDYSARHAWLQQNVLSQVTVEIGACEAGSSPVDTYRVRVSYPYHQTRFLNPVSLPMIGGMAGWIPDTLTACATAQL